MPKKNDSCFIVACLVLASVVLACIVVYSIFNVTPAPDPNKICISKTHYDTLLSKSQQQHKHVAIKAGETTSDRDRKVLQDPLFPPLNRTDSTTHKTIVQEVQQRNMYVPTTNSNDTYRLVGYLTNKTATQQDSGGNNWKLFARQKDRHSSEFYIVPTNNNYDIKIMITDDIMKSPSRLRDVYTIPPSLSFNTPLLHTTPYEFVELPKTDFATQIPTYF